MKKEYTEADFAKGVRNPYYHKLCKDVKVGLKNADYELFENIAKEKGVRIELVIKRAIASYADMLRADED